MSKLLELYHTAEPFDAAVFVVSGGFVLLVVAAMAVGLIGRFPGCGGTSELADARDGDQLAEGNVRL